ncbi:MAG: hypothetical protein U5L95_01275 [Candidatus Saccharibacteria bacterium]|nr:hypothetical protein [Candidatus Saccharibacteria bacterium]
MKTMNTVSLRGFFSRFTTVAVAVLLSAGLLHPGVSAQAYWKIVMNDPVVNVGSRSFILPYNVLVTDEFLEIRVDLLRGDDRVQSETAPRGGGDGEFRVEVPEDGAYEYSLRATNNGTAKRTDVRRITVTTPEEGRPSRLEVVTLNEDGSVRERPDGGNVRADTVGQGVVSPHAASTGDSGINIGVILVVGAGILGLLALLAIRGKRKHAETNQNEE